MSPGPAPRQFLRDSLRAFVGRPPEYASDSPQTAEDWLALYRDEFGELRDRNPTLRRHLDHPPAWGTFARNNAPPGHVGAGSDHGFGWPRPALWYRVTGVMHYTYSAARNHMIPTASATGIDGGYLLTHPSTLELRGSTFRALPYRIHWRGLLTNTALFAILWFLILFIPGTARRALRRRRARCTACGYDLRGLQTDRCPECGAEAKNDNVTERPGGHKNTRNALATRG